MNMMNRQPPRPATQGVQTGPRAATTATANRGGMPLTRPPQAAQQQPTRTAPPAGFKPGAPVPVTAKAVSAKADELFLVIRQLCELLTKENTALKRYRTDEVKALTDRKEQLANLYQAHMLTLGRDPAALKGLDTGKRAMLVQMAARLAELMRDNASMLKANIRSIDTFFQAVTDSVRDREEKKSASYSRAGVLNGYAAVKRNLAVSFNQTT